jgi:hypothetical protein
VKLRNTHSADQYFYIITSSKFQFKTLPFEYVVENKNGIRLKWVFAVGDILFVC